MLSFIAEHSREDAPALVRPGGETLTYASLAMAAAAVVQALEARVGAVAHRLVAIVAADGAQRLASLLAVLEAGGVALPLDPRHGVDAARAAARRARAVGLVVGDDREDRLDVEPIDAARLAMPSDAALLVGREPSPVARAALSAAIDERVRLQSLTSSTRMALLGPAANAAALVAEALATLRAGGTLLDVARLDAAAQLQALARLEGNTIVGFPSQLDRLARAVLDRGAPRPRLARVLVHAARLSDAFATELRLAFPGADVSAPAVDATVAELGGEFDGERIDPAAFEAELGARPDVQAAALLVVDDERLGPRLVAFVVPAANAPVEAPPARVVTLASLPRTSAGAVDREALRRMVDAK